MSKQQAPLARAATRPRVVVIGLDGGTFDVVDPLIAEGRLPNLARLIQTGARGPLESTIPPVTGPAWTSFMTGKEPGKHGLFDFVKPAAGGYGREIVNFTHIRARTLWSMVSDAGLSCGLVGIPVTWPPPKVNGFVVSGMLTPGLDAEFTHPVELAREIQDRFGEYILDIWWQQFNPGQEELLLDQLMRSSRQRREVALHLLRTRTPDLFMVVFESTDRIHHAFWHLLAPEGKLDPRGLALRERILDIYDEIDRGIGEIVEAAGPQADVLVMSDHGFGPLKGKFAVNTWLMRQGFMKCRGWDRLAMLARDRAGAAAKWLTQTLAPTAPGRWLKKLRGHRKTAKGGHYQFLNRVDWSRTRAYSASNTESGVYLNLAGREPAGIVTPGAEAERLKEQLVARIQEIRDPKTGERLVGADRVALREDVYHGPHMERAPDILFFLKDGEFSVDVSPHPTLFQPTNWKTGSGTHRMDGIFAAWGPSVKAGVRLDKPSITDLAPTILGLLDVPIPSDMDGKVLEGMLTPEARAAHAFAEREVTESEEAGAAREYTGDEAARVEQQLKDLGYI